MATWVKIILSSVKKKKKKKTKWNNKSFGKNLNTVEELEKSEGLRKLLHRITRQRKRVSSYLKPFWDRIPSVVNCLKETKKVTVVTHLIILIHVNRNSIDLITISRKLHSTLSYALDTSSFRAMCPFLLDLLFFM